MAWLGWLAVFAVIAWLATLTGQMAAQRWIRPRFGVATPAQASPAHADLLAADEQTLAELGFEPLGWAALSDPEGAGAPVVARVLVHRASCTVAALHPSGRLDQPNTLAVSLFTRFADGRVLMGVRHQPVEAFFSLPHDIRRSHAVDSLPALFAEHGDAAAALGPSARLDTPDIGAWVAWVDDYWGRFVQGQLASRRMRLDAQGRLRLSWWRYPAFLRALVNNAQTKPPGDVPMARQLTLLAAWEQARLNVAPVRVQWGLMLVVAAAGAAMLMAFLGRGRFAAADGWLVLWLVLALALHGAGRFLAMRTLGYRGIRLPFLAALDGGTSGLDPAPSGTHRAIVSLAATLPGIAWGWAWLIAWFGAPDFNAVVNAMAASASHGAFWVAGALVPLIFNMALLLPLPGLEGGALVRAALPRAWQWLAWLVAGVALAFVLILVLRYGPWPVVLIAAWQALVWRKAWRERQGLRACRSIPAGPERDAQLLALCARKAPHAGLPKRFECVTSLRARLDQTPPTARTSALLLLLHLAPFALPLLHPVGQGAVRVLRVLGTA